MRWHTKLIIVAAIILMFAFATLPVWGMGPAVFLDSERTVISRTPSPDGKRIAQVERLVVGGVPSIVVMVRSWWMPNWYLAGCAAASHYQDAEARVGWASNGAMVIWHTDDKRFWETGTAPFHDGPCQGLSVSFMSKTQ